MSRPDKPLPGDRVTWRSRGVTVHGRVEEEIAGRVEAAGRTVAASDDPQVRVRSDRSGRDAVHRPSARRPEQD